jgi:Ca-activated chloride channel family protein
MKSLALLSVMVLAAQQNADIRVDVDLVTVACSVADKSGVPARGLKKEDFQLRDNGQVREIRDFWQESDLPLTIALVVDVSGSQSGFIKGHREAVAQFFRQVIGERDRAMVVEVAQQARLISDLSGSAAELGAAIEKIGTREGKQLPMLGPPCRNENIPHRCGGTALWHGLYFTAEKLKPVTGRKAMIVLSDGMDTGSDIGLAKLIEMTQSAEMVVYSLKYPNPARYFSITAAIAQAVSHGLDRLSRETGGLTFQNPGSKTGEVFAEIERDLRNIYVLGITPPSEARDGRFHKFEVSTVRPDLVVRYRAGYWARKAPVSQ